MLKPHHERLDSSDVDEALGAAVIEYDGKRGGWFTGLIYVQANWNV